MKFIMKHGKTEKDIHNLRQEIEVTHPFINSFFVVVAPFVMNSLVVEKICAVCCLEAWIPIGMQQLGFLLMSIRWNAKRKPVLCFFLSLMTKIVKLLNQNVAVEL